MAARLNKEVKQSVPLLSVSKQWGLAVITNPVEKITLPLTSTMLIGIAGDGGNGNNSAGFNSSLYIYTTANVYPTGIAFIAICK